MRPPADRRGPSITTGDHDLAFIPLVPFAYSTIHRPDEVLEGTHGIHQPFFDARVHTFDALMDELLANAVFREVRASGRESPSTPDLLLEIEVLETTARRTRITYALSVVGYAAFGLLGLPVEHSRVRLTVDLVLRKATDKAEIWRYRIDEEENLPRGYYYGRGYDLSGDFAELYRRGLGRALEALDRYLGS